MEFTTAQLMESHSSPYQEQIMNDKKRELISDRALLIWIFTVTFTGIVFLLATAIIAYFIFDCWIMFQHQLAGGSCEPDVNVLMILSIPMALGVLIGALLTRKIIQENHE
jgi:hypothetical protein